MAENEMFDPYAPPRIPKRTQGGATIAPRHDYCIWFTTKDKKVIEFWEKNYHSALFQVQRVRRMFPDYEITLTVYDRKSKLKIKETVTRSLKAERKKVD